MRVLIGLVSFLVCCLACDAKTPDKPHIVMIVADDLGWSDVSFHGSNQIPTPNIDAIAWDGIILNQYYVQPLCSPSRAALMTAKYPIRTGFQHDVIPAGAPWGLSPNETILPQYLKALGYSTNAVGKWHLGFFKQDYLPLERGFDSFFGFYNGGENYYTHFSGSKNAMTGLDLRDNCESAWEYNGTYGTELFTAKVKEVIWKHDPEKSLFLYVAHQAPHAGNFHDDPLQIPREYIQHLPGIDDPKRKIFSGMVSALDVSVGEIFYALHQSNLLHNTIFIFTTDNGGAVEGMEGGTLGSNWPLRGSKQTLFEGGTRGVAFVWSPHLRNKRRIHNGLMHITDWLPTILSAAGGREAVTVLGSDVDGVDQWPTLSHRVPSPRSEILLNIDDTLNVSGIRSGRFKLIKGIQKNERFHGWFDVEGKRIINGTIPILSPSKERIYFQNCLYHMSRSKAVRVLQLRYGKQPSPISDCDRDSSNRVRVQCGLRPLSDCCDPLAAPCLFDVETDPCEFYNIADLLPEEVEKLESAIDEYRKVMVPPANKPVDPASDPALHCNVWEPWM